MDTQHLKTFVTLAECLSFTRASQILHLSPSTLSRCIAQMEEQLGVTLFDRDNRSVALTDSGKTFLDYAKDSLRQWETLQNSLMEASNLLRGSISIYCSVTASYSFLYDILTNFRQLYPHIALHLHTGDHAQAIDRITQGLEDVAIAARQESMPDGIVFKPIAQSPLLFITAAEDTYSPVAGAEPDWSQLPLILPEQGVARSRLDKWFRQRGIRPHIHAQVAGHEAIVSMVSLGFGVGLVPKIVVDNSPLVAKVTAFAIQPELAPYEVGICAQEKRLKSPLLQAFWQQI